MRKSTSLMILILTTVYLSGCVSNSGSFCTSASPIILDKLDVLSKETKRQVLSHNEFGSKYCGW